MVSIASMLILTIILTFINLLLWWVTYKNNTTNEKNKFNIEMVRSIIALEKAVKKLNEAMRTESRSLVHLERRIDILESDHPDSDIDYATTDDHDNVLEVWFEGKKYVPEDKRDEDAITLYADNEVVTETTIPDVKCCARCKYYWPGSDHTCVCKPWLRVSPKEAKYSITACNVYEEAPRACGSSTKGQVDCPYIYYKDIGGNSKTEELLKRVEDLDYFYNIGLMSMATYRNMMEELANGDS